MIIMGDPFADVSGLAVSKEEATRIGMAALTEFYGISAEELAKNFVAQVYYNPPMCPTSYLDSPYGHYDHELDEFVESGTVRDNTPDKFFPIDAYRGYWHGSLSISSLPSNMGWAVHDSDGVMLHSHDTLRFSVDAETGELLMLQYFIGDDPTRAAIGRSDKFPSAMDVFEYARNMTALHNIEYANYAMQYAEDKNIFNADVLRAAVVAGGWRLGEGKSFELTVFVVVECADGEAVSFVFQGRERKEISDINFMTRRIDFAIDKDNNIVEPVQRLVSQPDSIYDFGWVYR